MILRPRQRTFVQNCIQALEKHGNTLGVANTGFGKTVALSAVVGEHVNGTGRALVVAHRDELTRQNAETFSRVCPSLPVSFYTANKKSWRGRVTFSMIQTLARDENLARMPKVDLLVYDEAHHCASNSYQRLTARARELNPDVKILGVTATPERSDNKGLGNTFTNVADIVTIGEMVRAGHLVPPRAMVIDIGTQDELRQVKRTARDYDQAEVEAIQNTTIHNNQIVEHWLDMAKDRPTVAFCSTIKHAEDVRDAFRELNIDAEAVHGELPIKERRAILAAFDRGDIPVLANPMILTEGWDCQICSCVMLLRISSHKSTMIQMVGRGLRKLDPRRYPGRIKRDCLVMDFGISLLTHGDLNADVRLRSARVSQGGGESRKKVCPKCGADLPVHAGECLICGYEFRVEVDENGFFDEVEELRLIEIDLINNSPFRWIPLFSGDRVLVTSGFESWAAVCSPDGENWHAIGGRGRAVEPLGISDRVGAIGTADDFMRLNETSSSAKKAALWMNEPASERQMMQMTRLGYAGHYTKIEAAAHMTFQFNLRAIERILGVQ